MNDLGKYALMLSDLDLDRAHFPHGTIEQFVDALVNEYGFRQESIRPLMQSRVLIQGSHDGEAFRIAVSGATEAEAANALNAD